MPLRRRQYHDVEIGEAEPVKCLDNGLWLCGAEDMRYAVLLSAHREHGEETGVRIEIAAPCRSGGSGVREALLRRYRGRGQRRELLPGQDPVVRRWRELSWKVTRPYGPQAAAVERANVILPDATLKLLDRNI
jgi:hypothetical protein